jgi:tetratricopeptide (TPR) repeat protein
VIASGRGAASELLLGLTTLLAAAPGMAQSVAEQLQQHRNLAKAFYENPATQYEAVGELEKALALAPDSARDRLNYGLALLRAGQAEKGIAELQKAQKQDPSLPHTWFNLGIAYKQASRYAEALVQLEQMVRLVPDEPISHYNLGVLYKLDGRVEDAIREWKRASELGPHLAGPYYQLATAYRQAKRPDEATRATAAFREIKERNAGASFPEDLEWSYYAELYDVVDPGNARSEAASATLRFEARTLGSGLDAATVGMTVLDVGGDGTPDLLAWSSRGLVLVSAAQKQAESGLEALRDVVDVAAGDFDNDGLADLVVLTRDASALYRQQGGRFLADAAKLPAGPFRRAVWLDYDHDYDLDLVLLGPHSKLLRNQGDKGWADRVDFPFVEGEPLAASALDAVADTQGTDLAVSYAGRSGVLYRDRLGARYEAVPLPGVPAGVRQLAAYDADADGWTDLTASDARRTLVLINDHKGSFAQRGQLAAGAPALWADLENRGVSELIAGGQLHRNLGLAKLGAPVRPAGWPASIAVLAAADFDADGRLDLAGVDAAGALQALANRTQSPNRWLGVALQGEKNLKLAPGSEVELRAGSSYQKKLYTGTPLLFGLAGRAEVDAVRITWPNGLIQNETRQAAGRIYRYKEAPRLSGSCPMIYTWNGAQFEFITDVLGVAPLGASAGDGIYFPVDHDEVVQVSGASLAPRDGAYEIRIAEELREVAYLDEIRLIAVDRPARLEIFTNDKFKAPPFPEFRLFGVERRIPPVAARDHRGRDVLERLLSRDRVYPDGFARNMAGVAELHHLDLDFGSAAPEGRALLVLSGWVDWADGSTFLGSAQASDAGLVMPSLQVKDERGEWRTVIQDMGIPAGKPKTIVVDLTGKFLSASREVRIVTNLCVYWDEIFLSEDTGAPDVRLTDLHPRQAELRFRGFSEVVVHPERLQPERFVYANVRATAMWNPTPGLYTRYGDVRPLLGKLDDRMLIMGSGDELRLLFAASELPPLASGRARDFLLFVDGWAKDGDANTAYSQSVEPLPYQGMPQYPYAPPYGYPEGGDHKLYREHYNTRPALRLIRPLTEGLGR